MGASSFLAGWASTDITPEVPCWMGGYLARAEQAAGVHDPLSAHASSTVLGACLLQCAILSAIEECLRRGVAPPVLASNNILGAAAANARLLHDYPGRLPPAYQREREAAVAREAAKT
jgi:hypothetical protein